MKSYHFEKLDSTSTYLKNNYHELENFTFISADYQTKGHGRYNRKWFGENKKDLMFSVLVKDKELISKYTYLSLASAVVIYNTLKELGIEKVSIKWPNDVFINDKKIAGILLESVSSDKGIEALVIGVGVNVNSLSFEKNMVNSPTSVYLQINKEISLEAIKNSIYNKFCKMFDEIIHNDYSYLKVARNNNYLKDKMVYANINDVKTLVKVIDINGDNSLKIEKEGKHINLSSGEISFHK